jgi:hypothetical protein
LRIGRAGLPSPRSSAGSTSTAMVRGPLVTWVPLARVQSTVAPGVASPVRRVRNWPDDSSARARPGPQAAVMLSLAPLRWVLQRTKHPFETPRRRATSCRGDQDLPGDGFALDERDRSQRDLPLGGVAASPPRAERVAMFRGARPPGWEQPCRSPQSMMLCQKANLRAVCPESGTARFCENRQSNAGG